MGIFNAKCRSLARLDGKTAVITGSNTGIGKECTKDFYVRGAKVIMACRNLEKANEAVKDIKEQCKETGNIGTIETVKLDLTSLKSVRECAEKLLASEEKIDILLNNAGIMTCPESRTEDGFEMQIGTNHLGHFLFTLLLMPRIIASDSKPARIVTVSSIAHTSGTMNFDDLNWKTRSYSAIGAYQASKLANVLFSNELTRRLKDAGIANVHSYSLHPGVIKTELGRHLNETYNPILMFPVRMFIRLFCKNPWEGAQTSIHCCVSEEAAQENGLYYKECQPVACSPKARNEEDAKRLWEESLKLTGLDPSFNPFKK